MGGAGFAEALQLGSTPEHRAAAVLALNPAGASINVAKPARVFALCGSACRCRRVQPAARAGPALQGS